MRCAGSCALRYSRSVRVVPIVPVQETAMKSALAGWGARTRTWEWRNQNPSPPSAIHLTSQNNLSESANAVPAIVPAKGGKRWTTPPRRINRPRIGIVRIHHRDKP